ncbi:MAG: excisionase [Georgfuchsia sp.]
MKWILITKLIELTGYTDDAIRAKIKKGVWLKERHWRKAPDGRILFNYLEILSWIEGKSPV